jgi:hypothetical protein
MNLLSGDHETRRAITTERSPKSVIGRIASPLVGCTQTLLVAPSDSGMVSHWPSGDKTGTKYLRLTGTRDPVTRASTSEGPFSGRALPISWSTMPLLLISKLTKYIAEPSGVGADALALPHRTEIAGPPSIAAFLDADSRVGGPRVVIHRPSADQLAEIPTGTNCRGRCHRD